MGVPSMHAWYSHACSRPASSDLPCVGLDDAGTLHANDSRYNSWSGYFTSRPKLKALSQQSHGPLHGSFDIGLDHFSRVSQPHATHMRRVTCSTQCPCRSGADWCLQSDGNARLTYRHAAEGLFALRPPAAPAERERLWGLLETARRNAGVVQHHDAITGTMCDSNEGCTASNQAMGAHNVQQLRHPFCTISHTHF